MSNQFTSIGHGLNLGGFKNVEQSLFEKGRKPEPVGTVRTHASGERYIKIAMPDKWAPVISSSSHMKKDRDFVQWMNKLQAEGKIAPVIGNENKYHEFFVDEDTDERIEIERPLKDLYFQFQLSYRTQAAISNFAKEERKRQERLLQEENRENLKKELESLQNQKRQLLSDMENDPEVLAEQGNGGEATDRYGTALDEIDKQILDKEKLYNSYADAWNKQHKPVYRNTYQHSKSATAEDLEREIDSNSGISTQI